MITQVKEGYDYIHIAAAVVDGDGKSCDASTAEAWFYKVSQTDGSISLDTNINGTGKITLTKQDGQTGFYGEAVAVASLSANEYVILYKVIIESIESITVEFFSIDIAKKLIPFIKTETDKIAPEIINKKDEYKADVSGIIVNVELLKNILDGRWKIENNQMIFCEADNVTEIMRFNLFDVSGDPAMINVFERKRI